MPKGIFLLIHDEIKGPQIKCSYYTSTLNLPQDFVSKLYMSHAGFKSSSNLEIKLRQYRSISCFTGNLDRRTKMEGILGIIFEESETFDNLDLFLQRNLYYAISNPNNNAMKEIFSDRLLEYLELNKFIENVEVEDVKEIFVLQGDNRFKSCPIKIGEKQISNSEMIDLYRKIMENQEIPQYHYTRLDLAEADNTFLIFKVFKSRPEFEKIIQSIKPYLENYFLYSLEILALFLFPSFLGIVPINPKLTNKYTDNRKSILQNLHKSDNYANDFNEILIHLINGEITLASLLQF
ncbi:MAG: hypothetical protein ACFE9R_12010 [Candidatus Hermodarchaeota archaeon]